MKLFYITLNNEQEAKDISSILLKQKIAVCTNWFPINCAYHWEGTIKFGAEIVLIVKTVEHQRARVEEVVHSKVKYTNFIAELPVDSVNEAFGTWLTDYVR